MPSSFKKILEHLKLPYKRTQHDLTSKPFDPFDPIHDAPKKINFSDVRDLDEMITEVRKMLPRVEQEFQTSPSSSFLATCETCIECIESETPETIGTLEWFNMTRRAQLDADGNGELALCYICWAVLRLRLQWDKWSIGEPPASSHYWTPSQWRTVKNLGHAAAYTLFSHDQVAHGSEIPVSEAIGMQSSVDLYARVIPATAPKFDMIATWIQDCQTKHGEMCRRALIEVGMDRDLTLIDVKQRCLVKAPGKTRYVALSYVWGKDWQLLHVASNHEVLFRPGALGGTASAKLAAKSNAPLGKVVTDAMAITSGIGERYLWIDALCIKQDEGEEKALELMRMASIYNCAAVTIVPIDNASAHAPIPGLGLVNRGNTSIPIIDGLSIAVRRRLDRIIKDSVYNTRGWCFQEAFLSRRSLYFSQQQVFFRCQDCTYSEDLLSHTLGQDEAYKFQAQNLRSQGEGNTAGMSTLEALSASREDFRELHTAQSQNDFMRSYDRLTSQYWSRALTVNNDVMDAFSAISTTLETLLDTHIWAGLPEKFFHHFLLWEICLRKQRGDDEWVYPHSSRQVLQSAGGDLVPSWSWMGWRAYCADKHEDTYINSGVYSSMMRAASSVGPHGLIPLIAVLEIELSGMIRPVEVLNAVYNQVSDGSPNCPHLGLRPNTSESSENLKYPPAHNILRFWARAAELQSLDIRFAAHPESDTASDPNLCVMHTIFDSESRRCGRYNGIALNDTKCSLYPRTFVVILSCTVWNDTKVKGHRDFRTERIFDSPKYEVTWWKSLNFMLVSWAEDGSVCERLGVGEIHIDAFARGTHENKFVRLQ
ncbi:hypothetical protein N0V93_002433 [Gnomoniopsis smithogilvyi]|uniref:Heterokaryon incompatibility domain-containing protein n=1 Tax=Gnomoniopsis smithogilvyi TaxID=1191159 RepID=A0A9W8YUS3_9PEZI|nr:hypothetical protein N0V93_002433 [Gnomoniopsis smithogilvyi]